MKSLVYIVIALEMNLLMPSFEIASQLEKLGFEKHIKSNEIAVLNSDEKLAALKYQEYYEEAIMFIKDHEGFAKGEKYICPAGYPTIGYGHMIKKGESFPDKISQLEADRLLRKDFNKAIAAVERLTNLEGGQKIAIAHFIFAKGVGRFIRSDLKVIVEQGLPIDQEIQKWCYYTKPNGKRVKSTYSCKIRQWELGMYNRDRVELPLTMGQRIVKEIRM